MGFVKVKMSLGVAHCEKKPLARLLPPPLVEGALNPFSMILNLFFKSTLEFDHITRQQPRTFNIYIYIHFSCAWAYTSEVCTRIFPLLFSFKPVS